MRLGANCCECLCNRGATGWRPRGARAVGRRARNREAAEGKGTHELTNTCERCANTARILREYCANTARILREYLRINVRILANTVRILYTARIMRPCIKKHIRQLTTQDAGLLQQLELEPPIYSPPLSPHAGSPYLACRFHSHCHAFTISAVAYRTCVCLRTC